MRALPAIVCVLPLLAPAMAWAETAASDVADQVRAEGRKCEDPVSAKPDNADSRPDERAWVLTCKNARYRVIFTGDTGARIEELQ
ncbi:MAG: hypothetical protein U1E45_19760 [Geminicoccaceae bacterium]